jgi:hypothetical protein
MNFDEAERKVRSQRVVERPSVSLAAIVKILEDIDVRLEQVEGRIRNMELYIVPAGKVAK